jgi:hypothetical protein
MTLRSGHDQSTATTPGNRTSSTHPRGGPHHAAPSRRRHRATHATIQTERRLWMGVGGLAMTVAFSLALVAVELVS